MKKISPVAEGRLEHIFNNSDPAGAVTIFGGSGIASSKYNSARRKLGRHDSYYMATSSHHAGDYVLNTRMWSAVSVEELAATALELSIPSIPPGTLLENFVFSGIPEFSHLPPTSRLVFPRNADSGDDMQADLAVWEQNAPCMTVAARVASLYPKRRAMAHEFIRASQGRRGVLGLVFCGGRVKVGDPVLVYPPAYC